MDIIRIGVNIALSTLLCAASWHVLFVESLVVRDVLFIGPSRYLLSISLLFMAAFPGLIAGGWITGTLSTPPPSLFRFDPTYVDPAYKGKLLVRYWYVVVPALICFVLALVFAPHAADTTLRLPVVPPGLPGSR